MKNRNRWCIVEENNAIEVFPMTHYEEHPLTRIVTIQAIVSADYLHGLEPNDTVHIHEGAWEMCICLGGRTLLNKGDRDLILEANQILFVKPGLGHCVSTLQKDTEAFIVSFTCDDASSESLMLLQDAVLPVSDELRSLLDRTIRELKTTFEQRADSLRLTRFTPKVHSPLGAEQMICCSLELMLLNLLREVTMVQGEIVTSSQLQSALQIYLVKQVTSYIRENLGERLTADEIALHFHYSRARLSAICKGITGMGLNKLIGYERIQVAKELLSAQEKTVFQISDELGFTSPQYFSHKFTQVVGCPPSKYAAMVQRK